MLSCYLSGFIKAQWRNQVNKAWPVSEVQEGRQTQEGDQKSATLEPTKKLLLRFSTANVPHPDKVHIACLCNDSHERQSQHWK